jgi:hypothetical protein
MFPSVADLGDILKRPGGKTLEFKRDLSSPDGALKTIVAYVGWHKMQLTVTSVDYAPGELYGRRAG